MTQEHYQMYGIFNFKLHQTLSTQNPYNSLTLLRAYQKRKLKSRFVQSRLVSFFHDISMYISRGYTAGVVIHKVTTVHNTTPKMVMLDSSSLRNLHFKHSMIASLRIYQFLHISIPPIMVHSTRKLHTRQLIPSIDKSTVTA